MSSSTTVEPNTQRPPALMVFGSMICALPSLASSSAMRPSMKPWRSLAASYSAFSDRSPCARASAIAVITDGRSTALRRCSSWRSNSAPTRVNGILLMPVLPHVLLKQTLLQRLQVVHFQLGQMLHPHAGGACAGQRGVIGYPPLQSGMADGIRIAH